MYCCGKQKDELCDFPVNFEGRMRGAVPSLLDGHDVLAVLDSVRVLFSTPL